MKKCIMAILFIFVLSSVAFASPLTDYSKGKAALDINYRVSPDYDVDARAGDINIMKQAKDAGLPTSFDGDSNVEWGFTYGIGNNWALQYRQATPKGKLTLANFNQKFDQEPGLVAQAQPSLNPLEEVLHYGYGFEAANVNIEAKTRTEEYNVLYKLDKNFSLFTGVVRATPSAKLNVSLGRYDGDELISGGGNISTQGHDKNIWQFGFVAVKPLNKDLTTYGIAALGSDYHNWEAGLGYKITKDIEFNVNYRDMKIEDMKIANLSIPGENYDVKTDTKVKGWGFGVTYSF